MKNKLFAALLLALVLVGAGFTYQASMTKWEYQVVTLDSAHEDAILKSSGAAGWELVTIFRDADGKTFYFKRPAK